MSGTAGPCPWGGSSAFVSKKNKTDTRQESSDVADYVVLDNVSDVFLSDDVDNSSDNALSSINDVNVADGQSVIDDLIISSSANLVPRAFLRRGVDGQERPWHRPIT